MQGAVSQNCSGRPACDRSMQLASMAIEIVDACPKVGESKMQNDAPKSVSAAAASAAAEVATSSAALPASVDRHCMNGIGRAVGSSGGGGCSALGSSLRIRLNM